MSRSALPIASLARGDSTLKAADLASGDGFEDALTTGLKRAELNFGCLTRRILMIGVSEL